MPTHSCKTTILFLTRKWPPAIGGMETYSYRLVKSMSKLAQVYYHVLPGRKDGRPPAMAELVFFLLSSMFAIAKNRKADIIHIGDFVMWPLYLVAKMLGCKGRIAITAYGLDLLYAKKKGALPFLYNIYLCLCRFFCAKDIKVIAISSATAAVCRKEGYRSVAVVPLGVDALEQPVNQVMGAPAEPPFVLFVGRLVKRKGAAWFTQEVLPLLPAEMKLVVVGKQWDEGEFEVLRSSPRVEYRGVVSNSELMKLRCSSLTVVMPNIPGETSDMEGFGLTAVEAAADGGILLASGIEGIVDAVVPNRTGFLLPALNPEVWRDKILEIQDWDLEQRHDFIRAARRIIKDKFSWDRVASETISAYALRVGDD